MTAAPEPWSRRVHRFGRLVVAGSLAAAALALPACGGDGVPPAEPGGNVDPAASSGVGGVVNKAKDTAGEVEAHNESIEGSTPTP